jgi:hypothetical protein
LAAISRDVGGISTVGYEPREDFGGAAGLVEKVIGVLSLDEDRGRSRKRVGAGECRSNAWAAIAIVLAACLDRGDVSLGELGFEKSVQIECD